MVWAKLATAATAFGQTTVRRDGTVPDSLTRAWLATEDRLPDVWALVSVRYVTSGSAADHPSGEWEAVAAGPSDEQRTSSAPDAPTALKALAGSFDPE